MVQLSATKKQTRETQLAQLYDVLGLRRVIARYDVVSTLHETGPSSTDYKVDTTQTSICIGKRVKYYILTINRRVVCAMYSRLCVRTIISLLYNFRPTRIWHFCRMRTPLNRYKIHG